MRGDVAGLSARSTEGLMISEPLSTPQARVSAGALRLAYFIIAISTAYVLSTAITLHAANPYNISNAWNIVEGWNPESNFIQLVALILLTALLFWASLVLERRLPRFWMRLLVVVWGTAIVSMVGILPAADPASFDPFHNGEQLSPSAAFMQGKAPFTDLFVLHGAGEDIFKPALGYLLFSAGAPSIGAYMVIVIIGKILAVAAFLGMIAVIIRPRVLHLVVTLWLVLSTYNGMTYSKTIILSAFIVLLYLLATRLWKGRTKLIVLAVCGSLVPLAILNSIDVGALMGAVAAGLAVALVFVRIEPEGQLRLARPRLLSLAPGIALTVGVLASFLLCLLLLGGASWLEFIKLTFFEIPKYQGLTWAYPLADIGTDNLRDWLPVVAIVLTALLLVSIIRHDHRRTRWAVQPMTALAVVLLVVAVIYLRFGVGRPDGGHFSMAAPVIVIATFFSLQLITPLWQERRLEDLWPVPALAVVLLFTPGALDVTRVFPNGHDTIENLRTVRSLPLRSDDEWLPERYQAIRDFLKENTRPSDGIFVVQPDPSFYYASGNENPTRFYISWFIDPQSWTDETLADLKADPPKYILYDTQSPYADSDQIPITDRFPEVVAWIDENYPVKHDVDGATLLSRR